MYAFVFAAGSHVCHQMNLQVFLNKAKSYSWLVWSAKPQCNVCEYLSVHAAPPHSSILHSGARYFQSHSFCGAVLCFTCDSREPTNRSLCGSLCMEASGSLNNAHHSWKETHVIRWKPFCGSLFVQAFLWKHFYGSLSMETFPWKPFCVETVLSLAHIAEKNATPCFEKQTRYTCTRDVNLSFGESDCDRKSNMCFQLFISWNGWQSYVLRFSIHHYKFHHTMDSTFVIIHKRLCVRTHRELAHEALCAPMMTRVMYDLMGKVHCGSLAMESLLWKPIYGSFSMEKLSSEAFL